MPISLRLLVAWTPALSLTWSACAAESGTEQAATKKRYANQLLIRVDVATNTAKFVDKEYQNNSSDIIMSPSTDAVHSALELALENLEYGSPQTSSQCTVLLRQFSVHSQANNSTCDSILPLGILQVALSTRVTNEDHFPAISANYPLLFTTDLRNIIHIVHDKVRPALHPFVNGTEHIRAAVDLRDLSDVHAKELNKNITITVPETKNRMLFSFCSDPSAVRWRFVPWNKHPSFFLQTRAKTNQWRLWEELPESGSSSPQ